MRRGLLALAMLSIGLGLAGCGRKTDGGDRHGAMWRDDVRLIHREWDYWGPDYSDTPSRLTPYRDF